MKQGFLVHRRTTLCTMMLRSGTPIKTDQLHVEIQAVKQPVSFYDQKINHDICNKCIINKYIAPNNNVYKALHRKHMQMQLYIYIYIFFFLTY